MGPEVMLAGMVIAFLILFVGCVSRHVEAVRAFERGETP